MATKVLVVFYSRTGNIATMAEAAASAAREAGAEVRTVHLLDIAPEEVIGANAQWNSTRDALASRYPVATLADMEWADAVLFGTPTRFGLMAAELKAFIDTMAGLWFQGSLANKAASVFTTTATTHGGNEATLLTSMIPLMHLGMVIVTPGYLDPVMFQSSAPYGATAVVGPTATDTPHGVDLEAVRFLARRLTDIAGRLKTGA